MSPNVLPQPIRRIFFVALVSLSLTTAAAAQIGIEPDGADAGTGGTTTLTGNVYLPSGQMLDRRIQVRLSTTTRGNMTTTTDSNGAFSFQRLATGTYTVQVNEKGFDPAEERVEIPPIRMRGSTLGRTITVQVHLKAKAAGETKTGVVPAEFANVPSEALECYRKAIQLSQAGDSRSAIEQLKKAVSIYPQFVMAFNELAVQYMRTGDLQNASKSIDAALKLAPDAFVPRLNQGILLIQSGRYKEAEPALRAAIGLNDESAAAHYYLGRTLARLRQFDEAETHLTRALSLNAAEAKEAHRYLGAIYNDRGDDARAVRELETYLQLVPNAKDAEQIRAIIKELKQSIAAAGSKN